MRRPALALAVLLALVACGSGGPDAAPRSGEGDRITVQAAGGEGELAALQEVLDAFEASRPGTQVEFTGIPSQGDHVAKLATGFAGGERTQNLVFAVVLEPEASTISVDGVDEPLTSGMAATVELKTGARRLLEYIFSPLVEVASGAMRER